MSPEIIQVADNYIPPMDIGMAQATESASAQQIETPVLAPFETPSPAEAVLPVAEAVPEEAEILTPLSGPEKNRMHLNGLMERGRVFGADAESWQWDQVIAQLAEIGYPMQAIEHISFLSNSIPGRHQYLAHWAEGPKEMAFYNLHFEAEAIGRNRAEVLGDDIHEAAHMTSPFREGNDELYGGRAEREAAMQFVHSVVDLALFTDVHIDGYHRRLMDDYNTNVAGINAQFDNQVITAEQRDERITEQRWLLNEETHAILADKGITNRKGLELYEERLNKAWDDKARIAKPGDIVPPKVELITHTEDTDAAAVGVDAIYLMVLQDVDTYDDLIAHVDKLKQMFYSDDQYQTSRTRAVEANPMYFVNVSVRRLAAVAIGMDATFSEINDRRNMRETEDELERQKKKKKAADKAGKLTELVLAA